VCAEPRLYEIQSHIKSNTKELGTLGSVLTICISLNFQSQNYSCCLDVLIQYSSFNKLRYW